MNKKIISLLLAVAMLCLTLPALAATTTNILTVKSGWSETKPHTKIELHRITATEEKGKFGKAEDDACGVLYSETSNLWNYQYKHGELVYQNNGADYSGYLVINFNFVIDKDASNDMYIQVACGDQQQRVSAEIKKTNPNYRAGEWNNFKFIYDPSDHGTFPATASDGVEPGIKLGTCTTYLNGVKIQNNEVIKSTSNFNYTYPPIKFYIQGVLSMNSKTYIDDLKIYYSDTSEPIEPEEEEEPEEPETPEEPELVEYSFEEDKEGFSGHDGKVTLTAEEGNLKYVSEASYNSGKAYSGNMSKDVDFGIGQFYKMEMRLKVDGVTPTFNGGNLSPRFEIYYDGTDKDETPYPIAGARRYAGRYQAELNETDGKYYSDWQTVEVDLGELPSWDICKISKVRIDAIKDAEGTLYIDYIKLYSYPTITSVLFDGKEIATESVPADTKVIKAFLSQSIYSADKDSVAIYDSDNVRAAIESVIYDSKEKSVAVTVKELDTCMDYTFELTKDAKANSKQGIYKSAAAKFKTKSGEMEYSATGNGNSATMSFENNEAEPKQVLLIATIWNDDKYIGKKTEKYSVASGNSTYDFNYSSVLGGNKAEVTVWEYENGAVSKVYGKKVYCFER